MSKCEMKATYKCALIKLSKVNLPTLIFIINTKNLKQKHRKWLRINNKTKLIILTKDKTKDQAKILELKKANKPRLY